MHTQNKEFAAHPSKTFAPSFCYGGFIVILFAAAYAIFFNLNTAINVDIAYLTLAAERLLDGQKMSAAFYDTNPPLSIIIQIPAVLMTNITGISLEHTTAIYTITLFSISIILTYILLRHFKSLKQIQTTIILSAIICTNITMTGYDFGQRDHILGMFLFPLALTQILITSKEISPKTTLHVTLLLGSVIILLKPHYGLIPLSIFVHRAIAQKRFTVIFDIDFLYLAFLAIIYSGCVYLFFQDFIYIIFPDVITLYASGIPDSIIQNGMTMMITFISPALLCWLIFKNAPPLVIPLSLIAATCCIPFILLGQGWTYHSIPAVLFFSASTSLFLYRVLSEFLKDAINEENANLASFAIIICACAYLILSTTTSHYRTHEQYKNSMLVKIIKDCGDESSFFMAHDLINISHELSIYSGAPHASRFPTLWFLQRLLETQDALDRGEPSDLSQSDVNRLTDKYLQMVADDMATYSPDIVFIGNVFSLLPTGEIFNFHDFSLQTRPDLFEPIWNKYILSQSIDIDRIDYMPAKFPDEGLIKYDIYRKKER